MKRGQGYYHLVVYLVIYFFFNGLFLPEGLLYTTMLTPVMLYYLFKNRESALSPYWILLLLGPIPFHWIQGFDTRTYLISTTLVLTAMIFFFSAGTILKNNREDIPGLFRTILTINALLTGIALLILPFPSGTPFPPGRELLGIPFPFGTPFPPGRELLWYSVPVSAGIGELPRLKLFTYEASYYALIMVPVFLYFLFRVMYGKEKHPLIIALACTVPLLASLSFGVIGALCIALFITILLQWNQLPLLFRRICLYGGVIAVVVLLLMVFSWPGNPVFVRLGNIMEGKDTSAMGRLVYSFRFAKDLASQNHWLFGVGPGQIKLLAHDLIVNHYQYQGAVAETVRIPNGMAETLATYGIYGFVLKLFLELWFFFKRRIFSNLFAFTLFVFLFLYQFTGSFLVNVAELAAWAIVFHTRFPDFERASPRMSGKEVLP
jgi:hypothetical protein